MYKRAYLKALLKIEQLEKDNQQLIETVQYIGQERDELSIKLDKIEKLLGHAFGTPGDNNE